MGNRKKIALTFYYSENWIAGSYYVANMIAALNSLADESKPELFIIYNQNDGLELIKRIEYPYINYVSINLDLIDWPARIIRKISLKVFRQDFLLKWNLRDVKHIFEGSEKFSWIKKHYFWVHDFQQCRLPDFFSKEEFEARSALAKKVGKRSDATLILSSYDAKNDFDTFFPGSVCKVGILRFASSLPDFSSCEIELLKSQYSIRYNYFICSNQFWQHKNHWLVIKAAKLLKDKGFKFHVVLTGKNFDFRNPNYFNEIKDFIDQNDLNDEIKILGFIDREVQLCLGSNAISYIQPSLFEGWSTTVEDVKNLNQFILLSDIPVHREQMNQNVQFFDPTSEQELSVAMAEVLNGNFVKTPINYQKNIQKFGEDIVKVFD